MRDEEEVLSIERGKPAPETMSDDDILDEIVATVRSGRAFGAWDRPRLRAVAAEAKKRNLLPDVQDAG